MVARAHGGDDAARAVEVAHQTPPRRSREHVVGRAAHVDVAGVGLQRGDAARGGAEGLRVAAVDLHRDGPPSSTKWSRRSACASPATSALAGMNSMPTRPTPPMRRTMRRKSRSVMPAIGASTRGGSTTECPQPQRLARGRRRRTGRASVTPQL